MSPIRGVTVPRGGCIATSDNPALTPRTALRFPAVRARLPLLLLLAVLVGASALHAHRAMNPTSSYQSADERSYGKLAINLAEQHHYGDKSTQMKDPLHWPPGAPVLFAIGHELSPTAS